MTTMERQIEAGSNHGTAGADSRMARVSEIAAMLGSECITDAQIEQFKGVVIGMRLANAARKQA